MAAARARVRTRTAAKKANELKVVGRRPEDLSPHPRNSRTHSGFQVEQIAKSIRRFGFNNPILLKGDVIVAGHARQLAALKLSLERVPTIDVSHMTDGEVRAYVIADNRHAENAGWDPGMLGEELTYLEGLGFEMDAVGYDDAGVAQIVTAGEPEMDPEAEWQGMPEFTRKDATAYRSIVVHMKDEEAVEAFAQALGCPVTDQTKFVWFPKTDIETYVDKRYTTKPPRTRKRTRR